MYKIKELERELRKKEKELSDEKEKVEIFKKIPAHLYATTRMKCEAIRAHSSEHSVRKICRAMELCESSYYQWLKGERRREKRRSLERELTEKVRETIRETNRKLAGDITYLKTSLGWVYLAAVMDLNNREIIGYEVSRNIDTELACRALGNAIIRLGRPKGRRGFHSDRGSQYKSKRYQEMLSEHNIEGSMSKAGCPYDNSCMESFFASLKKEYFYRREYATIDEVRKDLFYYIEVFYNRKRLHSSLGYMSPVAYRLKNMELSNA